jgi:membrane protein DedA with SNARE-associated domain
LAMPTHYSLSIVPRSRYLVIVAIAALCLCVIAITDVIPLPFEGAVSGAFSSSLVTVNSIEGFMQSYGYVSLFVLMMLESASLPIPSEVVLPFSGYLVSVGTMNFGLALLVSTVALLIGALIDYFLALALGRLFIVDLLKKVGVRPGSLDYAERWMSRRGSWSVLIARFIPGLRTVISLPAGLFRMSLKPFVAMTLVGSVAWSAILLYLGYSAGTLWNKTFSSSSGALGTLILVAIALVSGVYIIIYFYGGRRAETKQTGTAG